MSVLFFSQGMSDLLSPILFVMEDESEAFWCFVALMERLGPNFNRDQNGMHSQLFALSKVPPLPTSIFFLFFSLKFDVFFTMYLLDYIHRENQGPFGLINYEDLVLVLSL